MITALWPCLRSHLGKYFFLSFKRCGDFQGHQLYDSYTGGSNSNSVMKVNQFKWMAINPCLMQGAGRVLTFPTGDLELIEISNARLHLWSLQKEWLCLERRNVSQINTAVGGTGECSGWARQGVVSLILQQQCAKGLLVTISLRHTNFRQLLSILNYRIDLIIFLNSCICSFRCLLASLFLVLTNK